MWGSQKVESASGNWYDSLMFNDYLIPLIGLHWLMGCWEILLFYRQLAAIKRAVIPPPQLIGKIDLADFKAKRKTAISKNVFAIVLLTVMLMIKTLKLSVNFHAFLWDLTARFSGNNDLRAAWYGAFEELVHHLTYIPFYLTSHMLFGKNPSAVSLLAVFLHIAFHMFHATIYAAQFMMFLVWVTDYFGGQVLFNLPLMLNLLGLVVESTYIHCFVPTTKQTLVSTITTDAQLKADLLAITSAVKYPVDRIYVDTDMEGANAYFAGIFGAKMIAVTPELMRIMNGRSVAASVAHELGHWAHHHNNVLLLFHFAAVLCMSFGFYYSYGNAIVYQTLRFKVAPHAMIPVILWMQYVSTLAMGFIVGINSVVGCMCEYTADAFAVPLRLGSALIDSLIALAANAKRFPLYDTWFAAWFTNHPTIIQRIRRLNKIKTY